MPASAILQRLGAPERIVTILEGESLVNDATAITADTIAIGAVAGGRFPAGNAVGTFAFEVVVGTAIGLAVAGVVVRLRRAHAFPGGVLRRLAHDLDVEEARLPQGGG